MAKTMTETTATNKAPLPAAEAAAEPKAAEKEPSFLFFVFKLVLIVALFRSFVFAPFSIPSESMLPRLQIGDYLLASKWSYGFSNYSLPFGLEPFPKGRVFASQPERGDVVIFRAPPSARQDYIKRVIGLPGDQIEVRNGVVFINGIAVKKQRIADFVLPIDDLMLREARRKGNSSACFAMSFQQREDGREVCRYPRYRETLPNGVSYDVLDLENGPKDNYAARVVPDGMLFLMGDNRDNSMDSRFPAEEGRGVGLVPQNNLVGKAVVMMWSTDGSSEWIKPWTWFSAARWERIGGGF